MDLDLDFINATRDRELDIGLEILQDELVEGHEVINLVLNEPVIIGLDHDGGAILAPDGHQRTTVIIEEDDGDFIQHMCIYYVQTFVCACV